MRTRRSDIVSPRWPSFCSRSRFSQHTNNTCHTNPSHLEPGMFLPPLSLKHRHCTRPSSPHAAAPTLVHSHLPPSTHNSIIPKMISLPSSVNPPSPLPLPHLPHHHGPHNLRTQNLPPKPLLLQQLQRADRRAGVMQINHVLRPRPVAQVGEVIDELRGLEVFLRGEEVEVEWGGEEGDEFEFEVEAGCWGLGRRRGGCGLVGGVLGGGRLWRLWLCLCLCLWLWMGVGGGGGMRLEAGDLEGHFEVFWDAALIIRWSRLFSCTWWFPLQHIDEKFAGKGDALG